MQRNVHLTFSYKGQSSTWAHHLVGLKTEFKIFQEMTNFGRNSDQCKCVSLYWWAPIKEETSIILSYEACSIKRYLGWVTRTQPTVYYQVYNHETTASTMHKCWQKIPRFSCLSSVFLCLELLTIYSNLVDLKSTASCQSGKMWWW